MILCFIQNAEIGRRGKALFEVFRFPDVGDIAYNRPKSLPHPTEKPFT